MKPPVFIIGSPRSGTTLLRLMLTSHPEIVVPPECGFAVWWRAKYGDWQSADAGGARLKPFLRDLVASRKFETWNLPAGELEAVIARQRPGNYAALVSCVYTFYGQSLGRTFSRWGDKNNFYLHHLEDLEAVFPEAYLVHIVRDGRDVACSYRELNQRESQSKYRPQLASQPGQIAAGWSADLDLIDAGFRKLPPERRLVLRYEDLVARPAQELARLCDFLGEDYSAEMLNYPSANRERQLEPGEFLAWKERTLEPPTESRVGRYRCELSAEQTAEFERIAGEALRRHGYL